MPGLPRGAGRASFRPLGRGGIRGRRAGRGGLRRRRGSGPGACEPAWRLIAALVPGGRGGGRGRRADRRRVDGPRPRRRDGRRPARARRDPARRRLTDDPLPAGGMEHPAGRHAAVPRPAATCADRGADATGPPGPDQGPGPDHQLPGVVGRPAGLARHGPGARPADRPPPAGRGLAGAIHERAQRHPARHCAPAKPRSAGGPGHHRAELPVRPGLGGRRPEAAHRRADHRRVPGRPQRLRDAAELRRHHAGDPPRRRRAAERLAREHKGHHVRQAAEGPAEPADARLGARQPRGVQAAVRGGVSYARPPVAGRLRPEAPPGARPGRGPRRRGHRGHRRPGRPRRLRDGEQLLRRDVQGRPTEADGRRREPHQAARQDQNVHLVLFG